MQSLKPVADACLSALHQDPGSVPSHQLGFVTRSLSDYAPQLREMLGVKDFINFPNIETTELIYKGVPTPCSFSAAIGYCGAVQIEVIEYHSGVSTYSEFLDAEGEGLHHVGLFVEDFDDTIKSVTADGFEILQSGVIGQKSALRFAYLDTVKTAGIITEVIWASPAMKQVYEGLRRRAARAQRVQK